MNFIAECDGWLPRLGEFSLPALTGDDAFSLDDSLTRGMFLRLGWFGLLLLKLLLLMLIVLRVVLSLIMALCWVGVFFGLVL